MLSQRKEKDIWQQLYELELYETGNEVDEDYIIEKIKERYEGVSILEFIHYDHLKKFSINYHIKIYGFSFLEFD